MSDIATTWKIGLVRAICPVLGSILLGLVLFQFSIFVPTQKASQFVFSGVAAGISYAFLKSSSLRNMLAAQLVWFIVIRVRVGEVSLWLLLLDATYIAGIAAAVYAWLTLSDRSYVRTSVQRIVAAGVLVAVANAIIVFVLGVFAAGAVTSHPTSWFEAILFNLQIGTLIGLAVGAGAELAEWLVTKFFMTPGD